MQKTFHVEQRHQALLYEPPLHQEQAGVVGAGTPCTKSETQQKLRVGVSAKVKRVCGSQEGMRKSRGSEKHGFSLGYRTAAQGVGSLGEKGGFYGLFR